MKAVLIIVVTMLMDGGAGPGYMDLELRMPQSDISVCEKAKNTVSIHTYTNDREYRDEYKFKIRKIWCIPVIERRRR